MKVFADREMSFYSSEHTHSDVNDNMPPEPAALHSPQVSERVFTLARNETPCHSVAAAAIDSGSVLPLPFSGLKVMQHDTSCADTMTYRDTKTTRCLFPAFFRRCDGIHTFTLSLILMSFFKNSSKAEVMMTH